MARPAFQHISASASALDNVKRIYKSVTIAADELQEVIVTLVNEMQSLGKKECQEHEALVYMFKNSPKGLDRGTLAAWFTRFTPLRVNFDHKTGVFVDVSWAKKGAWDIDAGAATHWGDVDPERTRNLRKPDLDKQIEGLATEIAKLAHISQESIADLVDKVTKSVTENLATTARDKYADKKVLSFRDAWEKQQAEIYAEKKAAAA